MADAADHNPFAAPRAGLGAAGGAAGDLVQGPGLVRHVVPVAILMLVQGALELLIGILLVAAAVLVPMMIPGAFGDHTKAPVPIGWIMAATYGAMGGGGLVSGVLHIVGGILGLRFRRRMVGIVALAVGMAGSLFTCYCSPTAIGLGIYGLVTYLNPAVIAAFALGDAGVPAADIRARFGG